MFSSPSSPARALLALALISTSGLWRAALTGESIRVRHIEGVVHGFLALRTLEGATLAAGDLIQTSRGNQVTSRIVFHFKDGSLHDETAVFTQDRNFQLISDHLVQKGPSFPNPLDVTILRGKGRVIVQYVDDGKAAVAEEQLALTPDLANGMVVTLLKNVPSGAASIRVPMVAATPKPRLVTLEARKVGEQRFTTAGAARTAAHYVVKVEIGGVAGLIAPLLGKQPPDTHVWVLQGEAPAFVRSEGPMYLGGPIWRIELVSPVWAESSPNPPARQD